MRTLLLLSAMAALGYCKDETVAGHGGADLAWHLTSIDGTPFIARATMRFPEEGAIAGEAPCNRFTARQTVPYPWFHAEEIATTTRLACPDLEAETEFLHALAEMTLVEVTGPVLILSTEDGREMIFHTVD
ncbi:META domain-containing protein [Roseovarius autotrophicus]|uniref:META domain-containing protein n=1 Tax=Roseovarius autotrophicus TaxID=2824121 RepID=UPI00300C89B8